MRKQDKSQDFKREGTELYEEDYEWVLEQRDNSGAYLTSVLFRLATSVIFIVGMIICFVVIIRNPNPGATYWKWDYILIAFIVALCLNWVSFFRKF